MPILILPPRYTEDSIALWEAATRRNWDTERLQGWRIPEWLSERDVVFYGEPLLASAVTQSLNVALLEPPFDWLAHLPERHRGRKVEYTTLGHARELREPAFVKPADDKCFKAAVYDSGDLLPKSGLLADTIPVLIAEPVIWELEVRCFVLDQHVKTSSPYFRHGQLAQKTDGRWPYLEQEYDQAMAFAGKVLADPEVRIPPAVVMDVGVIAGHGWAVLELNSAWGSGLYGCDPNIVLDVITRACVKKASMAVEDKAWIVERQE
jgi:hypothetical protein